jgi:hypothetical protein
MLQTVAHIYTLDEYFAIAREYVDRDDLLQITYAREEGVPGFFVYVMLKGDLDDLAIEEWFASETDEPYLVEDTGETDEDDSEIEP